MKRQARNNAMSQPTLESQILDKLSLLNKPQQMLVLSYVKRLIDPSLRKNEGLLKLAGTIDKESLDEMERVIREDCGQIED